MHAQLAEAHGIYRMAADVRDSLLASLSDDDLKFVIPGNPSLGVLLASHASVQQSYIDSFKTHTHDWASVRPDATLGGSIATLTAAFAALDAELQRVLEAVTD